MPFHTSTPNAKDQPYFGDAGVVYIEIPVHGHPEVDGMWYGNAMQVQEINGCAALCMDADGTQREVDLTLVDDEPLAIGDFVLVHAGFAIRRASAEEVRSALELDDLSPDEAF